MRGLAFGYALLALAALALGDSSSFFEVDEEFHRRNRELLQDYENPDDVEVSDDDGGEDEEEERRPKEPVYSTEPCTFLNEQYDWIQVLQHTCLFQVSLVIAKIWFYVLFWCSNCICNITPSHVS